MKLCPAITATGKPCSRGPSDPERYANKSLNFSYCPIHIWKAPKVVSEEWRKFESALKSVLSVTKIELCNRLTAAKEAKMICKRLYPWRIGADSK